MGGCFVMVFFWMDRGGECWGSCDVMIFRDKGREGERKLDKCGV